MLLDSFIQAMHATVNTSRMASKTDFHLQSTSPIEFDDIRDLQKD